MCVDQISGAAEGFNGDVDIPQQVLVGELVMHRPFEGILGVVERAWGDDDELCESCNLWRDVQRERWKRLCGMPFAGLPIEADDAEAIPAIVLYHTPSMAQRPQSPPMLPTGRQHGGH